MLAFWCGDDHLPDTGGVLDQDYRTMKRMRATRNVYDAVRQAKNATGKQIHSLSPSTLNIIASLRKQGLM
jgi:hypothetical protein